MDNHFVMQMQILIVFLKESITSNLSHFIYFQLVKNLALDQVSKDLKMHQYYTYFNSSLMCKHELFFPKNVTRLQIVFYDDIFTGLGE